MVNGDGKMIDELKVSVQFKVSRYSLEPKLS